VLVAVASHPNVIAARTPVPVYLLFEVEAKVYRKGFEISSEDPEERRWYNVDVVVQPEDVPTYSLYQNEGDAVFQPQCDGSI